MRLWTGGNLEVVWPPQTAALPQGRGRRCWHEGRGDATTLSCRVRSPSNPPRTDFILRPFALSFFVAKSQVGLVRCSPSDYMHGVLSRSALRPPTSPAPPSKSLQTPSDWTIHRRSAPLEVALREGQLACAAVLIEGGAHINVQALRTVKLEPISAASSPDDRCDTVFWERVDTDPCSPTLPCVTFPRVLSFSRKKRELFYKLEEGRYRLL